MSVWDDWQDGAPSVFCTPKALANAHLSRVMTAKQSAKPKVPPKQKAAKPKKKNGRPALQIDIANARSLLATGMKQPQVAAILGCSVDTLAIRLAAANRVQIAPARSQADDDRTSRIRGRM